jgi:hypothetical protein
MGASPTRGAGPAPRMTHSCYVGSPSANGKTCGLAPAAVPPKAIRDGGSIALKELVEKGSDA